MANMGAPLPASPRDNHVIHGQVLQKILTQGAAPILSTPQGADPHLMKTTELYVNHLAEHLNLMATLGQNNTPEFKELEKFFEGFKKQLTEVIQIQAEAKVHTQAVIQKIGQEGLPPGEGAEVQSVPEAPAAATAPGLVPGGEAPTLSNTGPMAAPPPMDKAA